MSNSEVENIQVRKTRPKLEIMKSEVQFEVRNNNVNSENKVGKNAKNWKGFTTLVYFSNNLKVDQTSFQSLDMKTTRKYVPPGK